MQKILILLAIVLAGWQVEAQKPQVWSSGEIYTAIKKLRVLGSALYVAAHPDDENTQLISYMANERLFNTAYLSMTRGDGGQNLIGPEISELLGVIRTQELLAARSVDGGKQFFTRADDFGYSKNPEETLQLWGKDEILSDVVWVIRKFRPDVIFLRFDPRGDRPNHGHHTASAMLAMEAFDLAADPTAYPEQLQYVEPWQTRTIFLNTTWWFYGSPERFQEEVDQEKLVELDVGVYFPIKGKSNNEIAAESRSMHKCQGFGSIGSRGSDIEYLEYLKGVEPQSDILAGLEAGWSRVPGGAKVDEILREAENNFDHDYPHKSVDKLIRAYEAILSLDDSYWKEVKLEEITQVITGCMGLYAEAIAHSNWVTPGQDIELRIEATNRSPVPAVIEEVKFGGFNISRTKDLALEPNQATLWSDTLTLPSGSLLTNAYWLNQSPEEIGRYTVDNRTLIGLPETPDLYNLTFRMKIQGQPFELEVPLSYKERDRVDGEVYKPFEVVPPVFTNLEKEVLIFGSEDPKPVKVRLKSANAGQKGDLRLSVPEGWIVHPESIPFELDLPGEEQSFEFTVTPPAHQDVVEISAIADVGGYSCDRALKLIDYDHIPMQTVLVPAKARAARIELKKSGDRIGYVMGAGDQIPEFLREIGFEVDILDPADISPDILRPYDAVIAGVRAYNTVERLRFVQDQLMDYVRDGGTYIVQYNTSRGLVTDDLGPYPLELSRERVSVEEAPVRILKPDHPVLNHPNRITQADFEGWVQERGLYFPGEWSDEYEAILSSNDPGESPSDGGLLVARYGSGYFVYTGYSWFRELPAGVPGAFRIYANLVSLGNGT